jgi:peptidoglycan L-alanyl-D-glutamate endopeptidase CwlK
MLRGAVKLRQVHPELVRLFEDVGSRRDIFVIEGARSVADEILAIRSHHSSLRDPMNSLHVIDPVRRPLALAVDVTPSPIDWGDIPRFEELAAFVKQRAAALGIPIVWGGDWHTFRDMDHYELSSASASPTA